jgi:colanic acid biosynthesis glycosyl transferase WcaI
MAKENSTTKNHLKSVALLFSIYFPPEPGGGSTAAWNRGSILYKIGYNIFVVCGFPSYPSGKVLDPRYKGKFFCIETMDNFTLLRLRLIPLETEGYLRRLLLFMNFIFSCLIFMPKILRITGKVDLVYSIAPIIFSSYIGAFYAKLTRSFFVYEVSDLWPEELVVFGARFSFIIFSVGRFVAKLSYIFPDVVVTISNLAAEHVTRVYKPNASVCVLPIGVDVNKFQGRAKDEARKELIKNKIIPDILQNKFIILYSGLISNATRVENLVYAASKLIDDKDLAFLIIGDGETKQRLQEIKSDRDIKNLYLLPFQPRTFMPSIISSADVCVVSLPSEPIFDVDVPTKFYEYLACYKPQIGICAGELAKIINSNHIGFTVNDGDIDKIVDSIKMLKNSPSLIESMEKNSHTTLLAFSLDNLASNFAEVLKKAIITEKQK